jgi:hypothetical protein
MDLILAGENQAVLRYSIIVVVLLTLWLHWRAAYTAEVRSALTELPGSPERLDELLQDVRDRRLIHQCRAVLADQRSGNQPAFEQHRADAFARIEHLETFAPLRRLLPGAS